MLSQESESIEIDNVFYRCGRLKRTVLITYLATTPQSGTGKSGMPELTAFDCSHRHICGVCAPAGLWMSCRWERCVHPGLAAQESSAEPDPESTPVERADP